MTQYDSAWNVLSSRRVVDATHLRVRSEEVELPDGTVIPDYYIIESRGWVGIVPLMSDGRFLINRQYKHGIGHEVLEFPAGGIDEGEHDPLQVAHRELMEETGYGVESDQITLLSEMIGSPTNSTSRVWWYLAQNVRKTGEQKLDPAEEIENLFVTPRELLDLIRSGDFAVQGHIAAAYLALERLGLLSIAL